MTTNIVGKKDKVTDGCATTTLGIYPQTLVTDADILSALGGYDSTWTPRSGCYIEGKATDYIYYTDREYDGKKYRGIYFDRYRPCYPAEASTEAGSLQGKNGYRVGVTYWFSYEPIVWQILRADYTEDGSALLVSERVLDAQSWDYDGSSSNNYAESTVRTWLNTVFAEVAFADGALVAPTKVVNDALSTGFKENKHVCADTLDKVFLLSYAEATATPLHENGSRRKQPTDYALCMGSTDIGGYCNWKLRSPCKNYPDSARFVCFDGNPSYVASVDGVGEIAPAITAKLY